MVRGWTSTIAFLSLSNIRFVARHTRDLDRDQGHTRSRSQLARRTQACAASSVVVVVHCVEESDI